jgi:hypothetical protein
MALPSGNRQTEASGLKLPIVVTTSKRAVAAAPLLRLRQSYNGRSPTPQGVAGAQSVAAEGLISFRSVTFPSIPVTLVNALFTTLGEMCAGQ